MSTTVKWILGAVAVLGLLFWMLGGGDEAAESLAPSTPAATPSKGASLPSGTPAEPAPTSPESARDSEEPGSQEVEPPAEAASELDADFADDDFREEAPREADLPYDEPGEYSRELEEALNNPPEPTFGAAWQKAIETPYELPPEIEAVLENPPEVTHSDEVERLLRERPPVPIPRETQDAIDGPMPPTPLPE